MFRTHSIWTNRIGLLTATVAALLVLADRTGLWPGLQDYTNVHYTWVLLLGAFALLLGIGNVAWNHLRRVRQGEEEWVLSLLLLLVMFAVLAAGLLSPNGTTSPLMEWIFDSIIAPAQASLFALTAFFLIAAAYYFLRLNHPGGIWIVLATVVILVAQTPLTRNNLPAVLINFADWLLVWPVMAALRGALLGAGLAAVLAGARLYMRNR